MSGRASGSRRSGVFMVEACSLGAGEWGPADRPAVAGALVRWLRESPDPGRPVRVVVAVAGRRPGDRLCGRVHAPGGGSRRDRGHQARLRRAARRSRPAGRPARPVTSRWTRLSWRRRPPSGPGREAALDYLREQFRRIPRCLYAVAGGPAERRVAGGGAVLGGRGDGGAAGGGADPGQPVQRGAGGGLRGGRPPGRLPGTGLPAGVKQPFRAPTWRPTSAPWPRAPPLPSG